MPTLRARAGVLTGSAAVELGAEGEGMVLGDTVNTASRLQSIAEPGTVLVDDVTRRASEAAIAYEDAGVHEVKGREQPVHAWAALRVVAGAGGAPRGRGARGAVRRTRSGAAGDHRSGRRERRRRTGAAWSPSSVKLVRASRGCCGSSSSTSTGSRSSAAGIRAAAFPTARASAYWALAEMVRARAGIIEEDDPASAREKLRAHRRAVRGRRARAQAGRAAPRAPAAARGAPGCRSRRSVPRLAAVLRADVRRRPGDPCCSRICSGRTQDCWTSSTTCSSGRPSFPIFVLTLGRLELAERRPGWAPVDARAFSSRDAIATMLEGLAPGLPDELVERDRPRAPKGCRFTRSRRSACCQDRGVLVQEGARYVVDGRDLGARGARDAPGAGRLAPRRSLRRRSGRCSRTPRCSANRSPLPRPPRSAAWRSRRSRRPRRAGGQAGTGPRRRPPLARAWTVRLPAGPAPHGRATGRCRAARARHDTWRPRAISSRPGRARRRTSPRCWRRTTWRGSGPIRTPRT